MKIETARCAVENLRQISTAAKERVLKTVMLNSQTTQRVYDLEIEDDHCYFANGILVSNSNAGDCWRYVCMSVSKIEKSGGNEGAFEAHRKLVDNRRHKI